MFMVGLLPAVAAFIIRRTLHEPEIFIKRHAFTKGNSFRPLVKNGKTLKMTIGIAILCSVQNFGYYGMMTWMPTYLATSLGFDLGTSGLWTAVTIVGMALRHLAVRS